MKTLDRWIPIACVIALSFTISSSAVALTFANVTGSGDLSITVTGDVYLDTVALDLTDLTLSASTSIVLSDAFPIGVPGTPTETIDLHDISGSTEFSVLGDAYFDELDFTGRLTIQADRIHVVGPLTASDSIMLSSTTVTIGDGSSEVVCIGSTSGDGLVVSTESASATSALCEPRTALISDGDRVLIPDTGLTLVRAIPEPSAALLFAAGIFSFATWNRRR